MDSLSVLVIGAFVLALVLLIARYASLHRKSEAFAGRWNSPMGKTKWNFTTSWATTLTTIGALLATVVSALKTSQFTGPCLFFGLLVLVAPLAYLIPGRQEAGSADESPSLQGYVLSFLIACLLTLWGVFGELVAIILLLNSQSESISLFLIRLFQVILGLAVAMICIYAWQTIRWTLLAQTDTKRFGPSGPPDWSLL